MDEPQSEPTRPQPSCFDRALRLLATRAHFREELRRKLSDKGYPDEEIEETLARLAALRHLDDARLATEEAERLRARKGLARRGVAAELRRKGVGGETIDAALEGGPDEREQALEAARRWLRSHRPDAAALARHLDRKGYGRGLIVGLLRELALEGEAGGDAEV